MASGGRKTVAAQRWQILKRAILQAAAARSEPKRPTGTLSSTESGSTTAEQEDETLQASIRSFTSFNLLKVINLESIDSHTGEGTSAGSLWKRYSYGSSANGKFEAYSEKSPSSEGTERSPSNFEVSAIIRHLPEKTSLEAMMGFNNTGNICVWPSEEVMAYYCLKNKELFQGKTICELGGGMTALAGIMIALSHLPSQVELTDGNSESVKNIRHIIRENREAFGTTCVSAEQLVWNQDFLASKHPRFDYVICADCLFFVDLHSLLSQVIHKLLLPGGKVLLFNPSRNGTLERFVQTACGLFSVERFDKYDDVIWTKHKQFMATNDKYKPDIHYPLLLTLDPFKMSQ